MRTARDHLAHHRTGGHAAALERRGVATRAVVGEVVARGTHALEVA